MVSFSVGTLAFLAVPSAMYLWAVRRLRTRGYRVQRTQQLMWFGGIALWALALMGPADSWSEDLFSAHMAQHLLLAELGAPLLLAGVRTPVYLFMLPKSLLVDLAGRSRLRAGFRRLRSPLVAVPVYIGVLYLWHFSFMFEGALRNDWMHLLQHESFIAASLLVWLPAIEPQRRRLPGHLWKIAHIGGARLGGMLLGMAFVATRTPMYGFYDDRALGYGLTPIQDQQLGGGMMMVVDTLIVFFALVFFFFRAAADSDRAQSIA